jgi:hypothetical protein
MDLFFCHKIEQVYGANGWVGQRRKARAKPDFEIPVELSKFATVINGKPKNRNINLNSLL